MNSLLSEEKNKNEFLYYVVINHEEQYSIWPAYKPIPFGWKSIGEARDKETCLNYIDKVWIDMRPLSLRLKMDDINTDAE